MSSETTLPELAAVVCATENIAGDNRSFVLTARRTRSPATSRRTQTVALVGVTLPHQAPLTKGDAVWADDGGRPANKAKITTNKRRGMAGKTTADRMLLQVGPRKRQALPVRNEAVN